MVSVCCLPAIRKQSIDVNPIPRSLSALKSLWRKEQARSQRVVPYRVPTRKELREHLGTAEPAITICAGKKAFGRCRGLHGESESGTLRATWRPREIENALFGGVFI
jgi:hypothetical protein